MTLAGSAVALVVIPKVDAAAEAVEIAAALGKPVYAMIETPAGVLAAPSIVAALAVLGVQIRAEWATCEEALALVRRQLRLKPRRA